MGTLAVCASFLFAKSVFAKPYDVIMKENDFAEISVVGINELNKIEFQYVCESFYNMYKDLYGKLFGKDRPALVINNVDTYNEIKLCKGPDWRLSADKGFLCSEIDPNRGDRDENEDDKKFLSQYYELDKNLAITLYNEICKNIVL